MNIQELDKAALKEVLREILMEDPSLLKTSMREIMDEVAYLRPSDGIGNLLRMTKEIRPSTAKTGS